MRNRLNFYICLYKKYYVFYVVHKVLELYNNPGVGQITATNNITVYIRANQVPAWPLENCTELLA